MLDTDDKSMSRSCPRITTNNQFTIRATIINM